MKNICVYASSGKEVKDIYYKKTQELGKLLAENGWGLIFGGGMTGLMGVVANSILENGGTVTGIIPELLNVKNVVFEKCTELIVTKTLRERKQIMEDKSEAFIALPGGFGTLEELLEIITLKQLKYHQKPVIVMNFDGYYNGLKSVFENVYLENFAKVPQDELYYFTDDPADALAYLQRG